LSKKQKVASTSSYANQLPQSLINAKSPPSTTLPFPILDESSQNLKDPCTPRVLEPHFDINRMPLDKPYYPDPRIRSASPSSMLYPPHSISSGRNTMIIPPLTTPLPLPRLPPASSILPPLSRPLPTSHVDQFPRWDIRSRILSPYAAKAAYEISKEGNQLTADDFSFILDVLDDTAWSMYS